MDQNLLWEENFDLQHDMEGWYVHEFYVHHPNARLEGVERREERDPRGQLSREWGALMVHDRGYVGRKAEHLRWVGVIRRINAITPLPDWAGRLLGTFKTNYGKFTWLVFLPAEGKLAPVGAGTPAHAECRKSASPAPLPAPSAAKAAPSETESPPAPHEPAPPPPAEEDPW